MGSSAHLIEYIQRHIRKHGELALSLPFPFPFLLLLLLIFGYGSLDSLGAFLCGSLPIVVLAERLEVGLIFNAAFCNVTREARGFPLH